MRLLIDLIHEPHSSEESTLTEYDSLQAQTYIVLDRREEVRQAPQVVMDIQAILSCGRGNCEKKKKSLQSHKKNEILPITPTCIVAPHPNASLFMTGLSLRPKFTT